MKEIILQNYTMFFSGFVCGFECRYKNQFILGVVLIPTLKNQKNMDVISNYIPVNPVIIRF